MVPVTLVSLAVGMVGGVTDGGEGGIVEKVQIYGIAMFSSWVSLAEFDRVTV
jgi:hypothetical protein